MYVHVDKPKEYKSKAVAHRFSKPSNSRMSTVSLVDNRPEAIAQRKLQEMANCNPQIQIAAQLQAGAINYDPAMENKELFPDTSASVQSQNERLQLAEEELVQRKFEPIQLGRKKEASQEEKWKKEIEKYGFESGEVTIGGMGTKGADIKAYDTERLWLFEVKGKNNWESAANIAHEGNVPAKQLADKLRGKLNTYVKALPRGGGSEESVEVKDYISEQGYYFDARQQILLGASNMDINDALLALPFDIEKREGEGEFDFSKGAAMPLSINTVLRYLKDVTETIPDMKKRKKYEENHKDNVEEIQDAWTEWTGDGRSFFVQNPEYLNDLEEAYTALRQTAIQQEFHGRQLPILGKNIELKFLPVVRDLTNIQKKDKEEETQFRQAEGGQSVVLQFSFQGTSLDDSPIQLLKFENVDDAENFLRAHLTGPIEEGTEWVAFEKLLKGTEYFKDMASNFNLLYQAYKAITAQQDITDIVAARGVEKRRELSEGIWEHIAKGQVNGGKVVGYHWKGLGAATAAEAYGDRYAEDDFGAYKQPVRERGGAGKEKATDSSFFPDGWSEAEVKMAIEYATQELPSQPLLTVTLPEKGRGMKLFFNKDSYFPNL